MDFLYGVVTTVVILLIAIVIAYLVIKPFASKDKKNQPKKTNKHEEDF